jgi:hypothetical protein
MSVSGISGSRKCSKPDAEESVLLLPSSCRLLNSIFLQNQDLREEASKGDQCQYDHLLKWLKAAKKDKRLKMKDPDLAAQVFHGLFEGTINYPALYNPLKTSKELKSIKDEVIAVFLSRYGV